MAQKDAALRKRQLIAHSNKLMFMWVAIASAVVGLALVVSWFLVQQIIYRGKVISVKMTTANDLKHNNKTVEPLRDNIRALEANEALISAKAHAEQRPLEVILDSLPADYNRLALGSSLQEKLIGEQPGVSLEALDVVREDSQSDDGEDVILTGVQKVPFTMTVSASDINSFNELLKRFERSVRIIDIGTIGVERTDDKTTMTVTAHGFYLPEKRIELKKKTVPVGDGKTAARTDKEGNKR